MLKSLVMVTTLLAVNSLHALEIDEKLTLRFLKVSNSKKTILINRGAEDGLAVGDHAKFFITSGVIARGVVEKVSPSRSIWSLYRVVEPTEVVDGKVLNLKISSPVKLTEDPSKSMKTDEVPAGTDKMGMKEGDEVEAATPMLNDADQKELEGMGIEDATPKKETPAKKEKSSKKKETVKEVSMEEVPVGTTNTSKNWEVWGTAYLNALTGTVNNPNSTNSSTGASASSVDFSGGIERYFTNSDSFLKNISITAFAHKRTSEVTLFPNTSVKNNMDWTDFGGALSYHFYNSAASVGRVIGYGIVGGGAGSVTSTDTTIDATTGAESSSPTKGTDNFFMAGVGAKYILSNGFGARVTLDYYHAGESYTISGTTEDTTITRTLAGPRIQFGLSYRF